MQKVGASLIQDVYVYAGHRASKIWNGRVVEEIVGPYVESVDMQFSMFESVNRRAKKLWNVQTIFGDQIVKKLSQASLHKTLFVIPPGESSNLDKAFSVEEMSILKRSVYNGMNLYATCGSAYWLSEQRLWEHQDYKGERTSLSTRKKGLVNIFRGTAIGPLCPYPGQSYSTAFFHRSVCIETSSSSWSVLSSGGGSFFVDESSSRDVEILAKYSFEELHRLGKGREWENAIVSCTHGKGRAILSMVHTENDPKDINPEALKSSFPKRADDWERICRSLIPMEIRVDFMTEVLGNFEKEAGYQQVEVPARL